jgi:methylated-DNA-protein-cysteine methyltransferase-like protein
MNFYNEVYKVVKQIPKGKVATYGQIAAICGNPKASRAVGYALHANPEPGVIPCHRVVNRFGHLADSFAFGGADVQRDLLEKEGIEVIDNAVNLDRYIWKL